MFKRHKIVSWILVLVLMFSLAGCGDTNDTVEPNETGTEAPEAPETSDDVEDEAEEDVVEEAVNAYFANMPEDIYKIDQVDFIDKVKADEDMFILDIRQPDVYEEGHIKGAVNAPWGTDISENLDKLPMDKTIMVYCYTGQTAGQTVALLNMAGFDAKSVNLGWNLGIEKVDGVDEVIETTVNEFGEATGAEIDPEIKTAIEDYFAGLEDVAETTYANYKISEDDAKALVDSNDTDVLFLSVRSAEDFAEGHIKDAVNIPWGKGMEQSFGELPKDKKIIVYCYTGQTAGQTVAGLRLLGYDAVSMNGGMGTPGNEPAGWLNKGYPVEAGEEVESDEGDNS